MVKESIGSAAYLIKNLNKNVKIFDVKKVLIFKISTALPVEPLTGAGWYNTWVSTQTLSQ